MKEITLYTTQKKQVMSYDMKNIVEYQFVNDPVSIRNSDSFINAKDIQQHNLPVQRFCWQTSKGFKEVYAAFDRELLELIGCSQEKFKNDLETAVDSRIKHQYSELLAKKTELETLQGMNVWDTLKWVFNRIWRNK